MKKRNKPKKKSKQDLLVESNKCVSRTHHQPSRRTWAKRVWLGPQGQSRPHAGRAGASTTPKVASDPTFSSAEHRSTRRSKQGVGELTARTDRTELTDPTDTQNAADRRPHPRRHPAGPQRPGGQPAGRGRRRPAGAVPVPARQHAGVHAPGRGLCAARRRLCRLRLPPVRPVGRLRGRAARVQRAAAAGPRGPAQRPHAAAGGRPRLPQAPQVRAAFPLHRRRRRPYSRHSTSCQTGGKC